MMTLREKHQQGQFTITVELDPPKSSSAEKTFEQAARLKGKVDAINIADSPMSKMRMSPISLSYLLQHNKEIETIFHLTCRVILSDCNLNYSVQQRWACIIF
jgi:methylenetetrahydrofolate reductase (NADPH)